MSSVSTPLLASKPNALRLLSLSVLLQRLPNGKVPSAARELIFMPPLQNQLGKFQGLLARKAAKKKRDELPATMGTDNAADCRNNGGPGAGAWLQPRPALL